MTKRETESEWLARIEQASLMLGREYVAGTCRLCAGPPGDDSPYCEVHEPTTAERAEHERDLDELVGYLEQATSE